MKGGINFSKVALLLGLSISFSGAQNVGVGTTNPDPSAALDIVSTDKGVLLPRIGLTSASSPNPISGTPAISLLIFNDGSGGITPQGFYWWNGSRWKLLLDSVATQGVITGDGSVNNPIRLINGNATGQVIKWDGSAWVLDKDSVGDNWGSQVAVSQSPIVGDGTTSSPIKLQSGTNVGDILLWNGIQWVIVPAPYDSVCSSALTNNVLKWTGSELCNSLIYDDGVRVGIGTSTPQTRLHVFDTTTNTTSLAISGKDRVWIILHQTSTNAGYAMGIEVQGTDTLFKINYDRPAGVAYQNIMTANNQGFVGFRVLNPQSPLHVTNVGGWNGEFFRADNPAINKSFVMYFNDTIGNIGNPDGVVYFEIVGNETYMTGGHLISDADGSRLLGNSIHRWQEVWAVNGVIQTSTKEEKKDVKPLAYGLKEVMLLKPIIYKWQKFPDTLVHIGFVAEDVYRVIPEVVRFGGTDNTIKGMSYAELIPVLTKAIQELYIEVQQLRREVEELKKQ